MNNAKCKMQNAKMPHACGALFAFCILHFAFLFTAVAAEEPPPVDVQVYYSKDDKTWPDAEKAIDAVNAQYPRLRISKISIDDAEGYKKLTEAEKGAVNLDPGEITLMMGPYALTDKGKRRDIET